MGPLRRGRSAARHAADAEDLLCPLCLELPASDVHCCTYGHNFCADCLGQHRESGYAGSAKCPSCRVALGDGTPLRNRDAERRIALLPGACDGCGLGMLRKALAARTYQGGKKNGKKWQIEKRALPGIPTWSPTVVLTGLDRA